MIFILLYFFSFQNSKSNYSSLFQTNRQTQKRRFSLQEVLLFSPIISNSNLLHAWIFAYICIWNTDHAVWVGGAYCLSPANHNDISQSCASVSSCVCGRGQIALLWVCAQGLWCEQEFRKMSLDGFTCLGLQLSHDRGDLAGGRGIDQD